MNSHPLDEGSPIGLPVLGEMPELLKFAVLKYPEDVGVWLAHVKVVV